VNIFIVNSTQKQNQPSPCPITSAIQYYNLST
jgi:hypothetical protein